MHRSSCAALLAAVSLAVPASAPAFRLPADLRPVPGNPVEHLDGLAIDDEVYDPATHCANAERPGMKAMVAWLQRHAEGVFWGSYRCERWGKGSASLHAENRAIDWHPASRAAASHLIRLLLAPDRDGNPRALARRMGIEEIIWDCSYWGAGMDQFGRYRYCFGRNGDRKKHIDPTAAHLDHVHLGMSKAGAAKRTSYWRG